MFEFFTLTVIAVGVIEEVIIPVGSQTVDTIAWAANEAYVRVDTMLN
jgi:hypothetical protein